MDSSSFSQADSPSAFRGAAGPSRTRLQARQHRNSSSKPYSRNSLAAHSPVRGSAVESAISSPSASFKSAKSRLTGKGSNQPSSVEKINAPGGLLSGLRQAIFSRPLSWLSGATSRVGASSLPSVAQTSAAQRLAASVIGTAPSNDIESHAGGRSGSSKQLSPPRPPQNATSTPSRLQITSSSSAYTPAHSPTPPSPARSSASAAVYSHGRQRLSAGPPAASPKYGGAALGTPGYLRQSSLRPEEDSSKVMAASQSSPSYAFGFGSERRLAGVGAAGSVSHYVPSSPLASSSAHRLPARSPFAMARQSYAGSSTAGSAMGLDRSPRVGGLRHLASPSRSRPASVIGGEYLMKRSGSVAESRLSSTGLTPKRKEWSSLKLAPPRTEQSEGEELMEAYRALRSAGSDVGARTHPALMNGGSGGSDTLMMEFGAGLTSQFGQFDDSLVKRDASMSVDEDGHMSQDTPRKRQKQMVWDPEHGFVSKEELRAKRPAQPIAQNEAERLLNALEGMRAPAVASSGRAPLRQMMSVSVPLPVSERAGFAAGAGRTKRDDLAKTVSPYSRAMKQRNRQDRAQKVDKSRSLNSLLKKPPTAKASNVQAEKEGPRGRADSKESEHVSEDERMSENGKARSQSSHGSGMEEEESEDDDKVIEPPRRKTQLLKPAEETRVLRSGKVLPPSPVKKTPASAAVSDVAKRQETPAAKPMSRARLEIPANLTSAASRERAGLPLSQTGLPSQSSSKSASGFKVLSDAPAERTKSSLRQGTDKMHRTHAKSGRVGLDDDDEDDEDEGLPDAEELKKIKLPTNLFPQGFTFSGSASPAAASSMTSSMGSSLTTSDENIPKALPAPVEAPQKQDVQKETAAPSSNSLLSRMGGFAAPPKDAAAETEKKSSVPTFSFTSPSSSSTESAAASASQSPFSFQPAPAKSSKPPSDFFSAPSTTNNSSGASTPTARNEGPIPNFFASSLAKTSSEEGAEKATSPFSFGSSSVPKDDAAAAPASKLPAFSFGGSPSSSSPATSAESVPKEKGSGPSFSFASKSSEGGSSATFSGFGAPSGTAPKETPSFGGFGQKALSAGAPAIEESSKAAPSFSFGSAAAVPAAADPSSKKRGADEDDDVARKRASEVSTGGPGFSFGSNSTPAKTSTFSFGTPKPAESTGSPFTFGSASSQPAAQSTEAAKAPTPATPSMGFTFGSSSGGGGDGNAGSGFGKPSMEMMDTSPSSGTAINGGGKPAPSSSTAAFGTAPGSPTPSSKPIFDFGGPSAAPSAPSPGGGFTFGSSTPAKSPAAPSFSFGASNGSSSAPFGQQAAAPASSTAFGAPPSANTSGGFGSGGFGSTAGGADSNRQGSPAPFTFGSSSSNGSAAPPTMGGMGGGAFGQAPPQSMAAPSPAKPAFSFGSSPAGTGGQAAGASAPSTASPAFAFGMPSVPSSSGGGDGSSSNSTGGFANSSSTSSPAPFVFGSPAPASGTPPPQATPSGGFNFNVPAPASPQTPAGGGGNLFNIGSAPSAPSSGNRPVRGMPSRRKR